MGVQISTLPLQISIAQIMQDILTHIGGVDAIEEEPFTCPDAIPDRLGMVYRCDIGPYIEVHMQTGRLSEGRDKVLQHFDFMTSFVLNSDHRFVMFPVGWFCCAKGDTGHLTLLFFDRDKQQQTFYDPAEHKWLEEPGYEARSNGFVNSTLIMGNLSLVEGYQARVITIARQSHRETLAFAFQCSVVDDPPDGLPGGCCAPLGVLFAALVLRFDAFCHLDILARALRDWALNLYHGDDSRLRHRQMRRELFRWHREISTGEHVWELLGLYRYNNDGHVRICGVFRDDGTLQRCHRRVFERDGWTMCDEHCARLLRL